MSDQHSVPESLKLQITPEPEGDEGEALIAAITVYLSAANQSPADDHDDAPPSQWRSVGRRASIRGGQSGSHMGWGRRKAGWP